MVHNAELTRLLVYGSRVGMMCDSTPHTEHLASSAVWQKDEAAEGGRF